VLSERPTDLRDPVSIVDRYITGTRLRLRRMTTGVAATYKLGQKVRTRAGDPELVMLTTIYLSADEYAVLGSLAGPELRKMHWRMVDGGGTVVDEFSGHLAGLDLAEVELGADDPKQSPPPMAVADVTGEDRFSGGVLANLDSSSAAELLMEVADLRWQEGRSGGTAGTQRDGA